ncbi:MAG: GPR endopeptidase [Christensenellaceae bacterium]|nr:GPR endopeptidase [Christensenellaceae bacterium]
MSIRTDLATELKEDIGYVPEGVEHEEEQHRHFRLTRIRILTEKGARAMKKPIGSYVTIDLALPAAQMLPKERHRIAKRCAHELADMLCGTDGDILIIGLGNRNVTADSLGPKVCENVFVTRHIIKHIPDVLDERTPAICAIAPGVLGVTGLESFEVVRGIVRETKPALVVVIDALAARNVDRLGASIQITNAGITPGSGLGNHRDSIDYDSLNVPVIAIGVPTVVYTGTIISDALDRAMPAEDPLVRQRIIRNISGDAGCELVVTPKDIDALTDHCARILAEMLDLALNPYITRSEIEELKN